ncbi:MAG3090 family protein [Mycoplasmopsis columbina]|uniref:MAG3090 family protein n=1 Tax=Mycoplasmopsis columbina TaxID=114881 RepID=UPI00068F0C5F|nr:hypothetical protein [Mycoplasmopsis columbina]VEU76862.1 Uncharacterised protein [Mycoplasmopsis columbina]
MKRLNCTYEVKQDAKYPWLLKHPKIKTGLAKFKTRQEALEWYMLLQFETAIWFQNDKRIFAGQLTTDLEDDVWNYYVKVAGFDGGATYEGICEELSINPSTFELDSKKLTKKLKDLDFVLLHDPYTYFPAELEIAKKERKDLVDLKAVEELKARYEEKINVLESELKEKEELEKTTLIKLNPAYYERLSELETQKQLDAVALYLAKLKYITTHTEAKNVPVEDYDRIYDNFEALEKEVAAISAQKDEKTKKLFDHISEKTREQQAALLKKLTAKENVKNVPENFAYYTNKNGENSSVAYETSFILLELAHIGFVAKKSYPYPVDYLVEPEKYSVAIIEGDELENTTSQNVAKEEKVEEVKKEEKHPASCQGTCCVKQDLTPIKEELVVYTDPLPVEAKDPVDSTKIKEELPETPKYVEEATHTNLCQNCGCHKVVQAPTTTVETTQHVVNVVHRNVNPMPEFWTHTQVDLDKLYIKEEHAVVAEEQVYKRDIWIPLALIVLLLVLLGILVIVALAILDYVGVLTLL